MLPGIDRILKPMQYSTPYVPPTVTVDGVIFQIIDDQLIVLLMQRPNEPFKDTWALPGGYSPQNETTLHALRRIVLAKTTVDITRDLSSIEQLSAFDNVGRDPRGHALSIVYMGYGRNMTASDLPAHVNFFPVTVLPPLAFDHADIIAHAHQRLIDTISQTSAICSFLPQFFTLTQLQTAYESILQHPLDKRNFRKKFLGFDLIIKTDKTHREGAHRPARLYKFRTQIHQSLTNTFD